jgi:hypothetical protein
MTPSILKRLEAGTGKRIRDKQKLAPRTDSVRKLLLTAARKAKKRTSPERWNPSPVEVLPQICVVTSV